MNLVEFLLQRIQEDEEAARRAPGPRWVRKYRQKPEPPFTIERYAIASPVEFAGQELGAQVLAFTEDDTAESKALVYHAVRWDPARVLAECEAKRRIVELADETERSAVSLDELHGEDDWTLVGVLRETLRLLALPYADHPHFNPAWILA